MYSTRSAWIVTAVLIGDRAGLDLETERRLQEGGTYHVIAISGGNIAILSGVLLFGLRLARVSTRVASLAVMLCLIVYAQVVGPEASVARATFAAVTFLSARAADHRPHPLNTLALAAGCLVVASPRALLDAGFQLTFGATLGILVGVPRLMTAARPGVVVLGRMGRWVMAPLVALLGATICAELALLPIAATVFSRISFAGVVLNFVAIPLMTVTQVAGMAAVSIAGGGPIWPRVSVASLTLPPSASSSRPGWSTLGRGWCSRYRDRVSGSSLATTGPGSSGCAPDGPRPAAWRSASSRRPVWS